VVLLDEPLGALDQQLRREMQVELKTIQERVGLTFLYVTHDQEEALTMSDRMAVMDRGRILQTGSPQEIYESPSSLFVANFIGTSNYLPGRVTVVCGPRCTLNAPGMPAIHVPRPPGIVQAGDVTLVLRPERLQLSSERMCNFENAVSARVEKVMYNGSEIQYWIQLPNGAQWTVHVANVGAGGKRFMPGEAVVVEWPALDGVVLTE
jgi:spermidine/putrescine transport system ATP-binding protein